MQLHINSVYSHGSLPLRRNNVLIPNPTLLFPDGECGLYVQSESGTRIFTVNLAITDVSEEAIRTELVCTLYGRIGSDDEPVFASTEIKFTPGAESGIDVPVFLLIPTSGFSYTSETILWELATQDTKATISTAGTPLRLCFIPAVPEGANRGIPGEVVDNVARALGDRAKATGILAGANAQFGSMQAASTVVSDITNWVINNNPPRYDTSQGAPSFIDILEWPGYQGGTDIKVNLLYNAYLAAGSNPYATCNCYDAAAVLQYMVRFSLGVYIEYTFMKPFGYMSQTTLIGRGQCNNPFYTNPNYSSQPICPEQSQSRSAFGNHSFIYLPNTGAVVADACAGPHLGNESPAQYVAGAVDTNTPKPPKTPAGTVSNIGYYTGVVSVNAMNSFTEASFISSTGSFKEFIDAVGYTIADAAKPPLYFGVVPQLQDCPLIDDGYKTVQHEVFPGYPLVHRRTILAKETASIQFDTWLASDSCLSSHSQYLRLGSIHMMPIPIFEKGPDSLGTSSGQFLSEELISFLWVSRNIVHEIKTFGLASETAQSIAEWVEQTTIQKTEPLSDLHLPAIKNVQLSREPVMLNDQFTIEATVDPLASLFFSGNHPGLYIWDEQPGAFTFIAKEKSVNELSLILVDPDTLLSTKEDLVIAVI